MQPHLKILYSISPLSGLLDYYRITRDNPSEVDRVLESFKAMYNTLSAEDQSCLIPKM